MGEINKYVAGICSTLLVLLGLNFFGELIFHPASHGEEELAFALEIEEAGGGEEEAAEVDFAALFGAADLANGEKVFKKCQSCHAVEDGANKTGPHLWGVVNRPIGSVEGAKYSGALPAGQTWTPQNLFHFLGAPKKWANGTSMSFAGLKKESDRADLIAWLNQADGSPEPLE